ncbi:MAG: hypothetical protein HPY66_2730 [Firmicutes bacterium]|nr:hypothetical protein [Bacillota bacterium]MDI6706111.1 MerR family transcriptional regulator [Bacillota bacterium]
MPIKKYRVGELSKKAGVTKRTVHYYVNRGLIPPSEGSGQNSYYTDNHLVRILLIKKLQERFLPLEKIRGIIVGLDYNGVIEMLEHTEDASFEDPANSNAKAHPQGPSLGDVYKKIKLIPGLELHCSVDIFDKSMDKIELLVSYVRKLFDEEVKGEY